MMLWCDGLFEYNNGIRCVCVCVCVYVCAVKVCQTECGIRLCCCHVVMESSNSAVRAFSRGIGWINFAVRLQHFILRTCLSCFASKVPDTNMAPSRRSLQRHGSRVWLCVLVCVLVMFLNEATTVVHSLDIDRESCLQLGYSDSLSCSECNNMAKFTDDNGE